ncbi:hypothetical protein FOXYSP1_19982 [Fusarium oxysporum f. sp. phaseoli]
MEKFPSHSYSGCTPRTLTYFSILNFPVSQIVAWPLLRKGDDDQDLNKAPKGPALSTNPALSPSPSPTKTSTASLRSSSYASSLASSSRRKLSLLGLGEEGIVKRQLTGLRRPQHPQAIREVLLVIQRLERGRGVLLATSNMPTMTAFLQDFDLEESVFDVSTGYGSRLMPSEMEEILADTKRCLEMDHDEPVWNAEVHQSLLRKLFRSPVFASACSRLVDFTLTIRAPIIREYLPPPLVEQVLGLTCKQGYFEITTEMVKPLRG